MIERDGADRVVCQVVGCREPSLPWGYTLDVGDVLVEIVLCRRHERDATGLPQPERNGAPVEAAE